MRLLFTLLSVLFSMTFSNAQTEISENEAINLIKPNSDKLIVLEYFATWCSYCNAMKPTIQELVSQFPDVSFYKIDVDKYGNYGEGTPTYLLIRNGKIQKQMTGAIPKEDFVYFIEQYNSQDIKEFYENGQLKSIGKLELRPTFQSEEKTGQWQFYYENGTIKQICNYSHNFLNGEFKFYHENGQLMQVGNYKIEIRNLH